LNDDLLGIPGCPGRILPEILFSFLKQAFDVNR